MVVHCDTTTADVSEKSGAQSWFRKAVRWHCVVMVSAGSAQTPVCSRQQLKSTSSSTAENG